MTRLLTSIQTALDLPLHQVAIAGNGALPSVFAVSELASASIATAGQAVAELLYQQTGHRPGIRVDQRLASFWFATSLRPVGWQVPPPWDPVAGDYASADGWIRLHTNAPHHRAAAEQVLGVVSDRQQMATRVAQWRSEELEQALIKAGGCAAQMRSPEQWQTHPQGIALANEPLVLRETHPPQALRPWSGCAARPLAGVRVLDLTRVIAGPVASRFLASLGAEVLRIDPPTWNEPGVIPEMTPGKRCARLDLIKNADRQAFENLLGSADMLIHGYRADALDHLGFAPRQRQQLNPGLIDISLNAYGWSGPWQNRRGFDSLVQMSCGIAAAGQRWQQADKPVPLPVQALDHATGYLMAAAALCALSERLRSGSGSSARLSLARTAQLLMAHNENNNHPPLDAETTADLRSTLEQTSWGPAQRLKPALQIVGTPLQWEHPASALGSHDACWR